VDEQLFNQLQPAKREAEKALTAARELAPARLVDAVLGDGEPVRSAVVEAERELSEAERKLNEARQARSMLAEEASRAEIEVGAATRELGARPSVRPSRPTRPRLRFWPSSIAPAAAFCAWRASCAR
jgi:hypothetical protein